MPELHFNRAGELLTVTFGEYQTSVSWAELLPNEQTGQRIYDDAAGYGRQLFDKVFHEAGIRGALLALRVNERLALVIDDPVVAQLPWEYLRDSENRLLSARLNLVRFVPGVQAVPRLEMAQPLTLMAIPVSPVDEARVLNTEREWRRLIEAVQVPGKALTLRRVRPPTLAQMEQDLPEEGLSMVHFMGHSGRVQGKSVLAFEDARACSQFIDGSYFAEALNEQVLLVVLNSCLSATVSPTEFGNIAQALVRQGVPYALGMQFVLADDAALEMSKTLYAHILQGRSVEEAVRRTRRALEQNALLHQAPWVAGIPVLYTHLREPAPALTLAAGSPMVIPDPEKLQETCDLTALPRTEHFVGRGREMSEALKVLLAPAGRGFVLLHGLGGIGKTSLAHALAERASWYYRDQVLAVSFETFVSYDHEHTIVVSETFADRFYNRLARFYGVGPAARSENVRDLQDAILQKRTRFRSLLILDNLETLIEAQKEGHPTAVAVATFISRLKEGDGMTLLTSRSIPPSDWGECAVIPLSGLPDEAGADLFLSLLPEDRQAAAGLSNTRLQVTKRVQGHPLSLRLLAGRFADMTISLENFLQHIEQELKDAEQATPTSLEDPKRQKTLYACIDYSIRHLSVEQKQLLHACNLFIVPFPLEFLASNFPNVDAQHIATIIQQLVRLGLLEQKIKTFPDGNLLILELHAMLHWYIQFSFPKLPEVWLKHYGQLYYRLVGQSYQPEGGYDQNPIIRFLIRQSLPDCDCALQYVESKERAFFALYLAEPYLRLGQPRRARLLYEQALEACQELGEVKEAAAIQNALAVLLSQQGKVEEAMELYEAALQTNQRLGDVRGVAVTQSALAGLLSQRGRMQEAMELYEAALQADQELGDVRGVAVTQSALAGLLSQQGRVQEAMELYEAALQTKQKLGDVRSIAVTQHSLAGLLSQQGRVQEAMELYEAALQTAEELGEVREAAVTQHSLAGMLSDQGRIQEAIGLYKAALQTAEELGDVLGVAVTQRELARLLSEQGRVQEAMELYEAALQTMEELGEVREVAATQSALAGLLSQQGRIQEAIELYEIALQADQKLGEVRGVAVTQSALADLLSQRGRIQEAIELYEAALQMKQKLGDVREVAVTRNALAGLLKHQGRVQEAMVLCEAALQTMKELGEVRGVAVMQANMSQFLFQIGVYDRALSLAWHSYTNLSQRNYIPDAQGVQNILISMKQANTEHFDTLWIKCISDPQPEWLQSVLTSVPSSMHPNEVASALREFLNTPTWEKTHQVLLQQQDILFQPEVEAILEQSLAASYNKEDMRQAQLFSVHLELLRACKARGIEVAFEQFLQTHTIPFDPEFIPRSIAALQAEPAEKLAYAQSLNSLASETANGERKKLLNAIQLALFGGDLSQHGKDLQGVYREAYDAIIAGVKGRNENAKDESDTIS